MQEGDQLVSIWKKKTNQSSKWVRTQTFHKARLCADLDSHTAVVRAIKYDADRILQHRDDGPPSCAKVLTNSLPNITTYARRASKRSAAIKNFCMHVYSAIRVFKTQDPTKAPSTQKMVRWPAKTSMGFPLSCATYQSPNIYTLHNPRSVVKAVINRRRRKADEAWARLVFFCEEGGVE